MGTLTFSDIEALKEIVTGQPYTSEAQTCPRDGQTEPDHPRETQWECPPGPG